MTTATSGKTSPLHERHLALGAKMADFGGWDMPIEYPGGGVVAEHTAACQSYGINQADLMAALTSVTVAR